MMRDYKTFTLPIHDSVFANSDVSRKLWCC